METREEAARAWAEQDLADIDGATIDLHPVDATPDQALYHVIPTVPGWEHVSYFVMTNRHGDRMEAQTAPYDTDCTTCGHKRWWWREGTGAL